MLISRHIERRRTGEVRHDCGFTLVELLVVVVVIVTLMSITFKLAGAGGDSTARNKTINRMQRLENCLSGYYAAYGSYPPVALHGSRDYTYEVDQNSWIQNIKNDGRSAGRLSDNWKSVEAACRAQPMGFSFPFPESMKMYIEAVGERERESNPNVPRYTALYDNSMVSGQKNVTDWTELQIYKYGVMSYLLPRYLVAMRGGDTRMDSQIFSNQRSWTSNNRLPSRFEDGAPYASWSDVNDDAFQHPWKIAALPSQAACARWLPNLEGIVCWLTAKTLYGVNIRDLDDSHVPKETYFVGGYGSQSQPYKLNTVTVKDGFWNSDLGTWNEFYYYSRPPFQSYRLWSAGPNCRTFPPWVTDEELNSLSGEDRKTVQTWIADDIVHMSN